MNPITPNQVFSLNCYNGPSLSNYRDGCEMIREIVLDLGLTPVRR